MEHASILRLLQLADSALPIGTAAHSFGLESLVEAGAISPGSCGRFLNEYLAESLLVEVVFSRAAHRSETAGESLSDLNLLLSARKPVREIREASLSMGRRLLSLIGGLPGDGGLHYAIAFGSTCAHWQIPENLCALGLLEQNVASALSALVRLISLGQAAANALRWQAKDAIIAISEQSRSLTPWDVPAFTPSLDIASMRHPFLETRLFIS